MKFNIFPATYLPDYLYHGFLEVAKGLTPMSLVIVDRAEICGDFFLSMCIMSFPLLFKHSKLENTWMPINRPSQNVHFGSLSRIFNFKRYFIQGLVHPRMVG